VSHAKPVTIPEDSGRGKAVGIDGLSACSAQPDDKLNWVKRLQEEMKCWNDMVMA